MKAGWKQPRFGDVCELKKGRKPVLLNSRAEGTKPYLVAKYLRGSEPAEFASVNDKNAVLVSSDEIIIICDGSNSGETFIGFDGVLSSTMAKVSHGLDVDTRYLMHFLDSLFEKFSEGKTGAAIPHLDLPSLRQEKLPLPTVKEQKRIVAILDEAFAGIATARANAEKNRQNARALFESHLNTIFSQRGEGWVEKSVAELVKAGVLAKPQDGNHGEIHPTRADYVEDGVPFIMAADLIDGTVDTKSSRFISDAQARSLRIGFSIDQDVLLSHKGTIGRTAILETEREYVVLTPQVTYYRILDKNALFNRYLYFYFQSPEFQRVLGQIAGAGSTRAYIGITRQLDLKVLMPPVEHQKVLAKNLSEIQEDSSKLEAIYQRKLAALDELKQSLLHQAFSGQL